MCACVSICGNSHGDKAGIISKAKSLTFAVNVVAFPSLFILQCQTNLQNRIIECFFCFVSGAVPSVVHLFTK